MRPVGLPRDGVEVRRSLCQGDPFWQPEGVFARYATLCVGDDLRKGKALDQIRDANGEKLLHSTRVLDWSGELFRGNGTTEALRNSGGHLANGGYGFARLTDLGQHVLQ